MADERDTSPTPDPITGAPTPPVEPTPAPIPGALPSSATLPAGAGSVYSVTPEQAAYAPPIYVAPQKPDAPDIPRHYHHALTGLRGSWWRGLLAIIVFVIAFFGISTVIGTVGLFIDIAQGNITEDQLLSGAIPITPIVLLTTNIGLMAMIPVSMLLQWAFFGVRPRFLSSVEGRFRWKWMFKLALIIVPVWAVYIGITFLIEPGEVRIDGTALFLLAVVILTTPLQAAGEEYGTRGLVQRSVGSWFSNSTIAFIVSTIVASIVFGLAHFAADPWLIAYYILFGAAGSLAARWTGGLEAPVLVHAVNNVLIFVPAALFGQLDQGIDRSAGQGGPFMLLPMGMVLLGAVISWWWARRNKIVTAAVPPANFYYTKLAPIHPQAAGPQA